MATSEEMDSESAKCKDEKRKEDTFVFWRQVSECIPNADGLEDNLQAFCKLIRFNLMPHPRVKFCWNTMIKKIQLDRWARVSASISSQ